MDRRRAMLTVALAALLVADLLRTPDVSAAVRLLGAAPLLVAVALGATPFRAGTGARRVRPAWVRHVLASAAVGGVTGYVLLVAAPDPDRYLYLFMLALLVAATLHSLRMQAVYQAATVAGVVVALLPGDISAAAVVAGAGWIAIFGSIGIWLGGGVRQATREETRAQRQLDDHRRLLTAVTRINDFEPAESAEAVVDAMREFGFDLTGLGVLRRDRFVPLAVRGLQADRAPAVPLKSLAGRALALDRPVSVDRYGDLPDALEPYADLGGAVAAPVVGRATRGVLIGARREPGMPSPDAAELVGALAAQAGAALDNAERMQIARERRRRLVLLDTLIDDFLQRASEDIRRPLTSARGTGQTLARLDGRLPDEDRELLLDQLVTSSQTLNDMISDLLDFSRQPLADLGVVQTVGLDELAQRIAARIRTSTRVPVEVRHDDGEARGDAFLIEFAAEAAVALLQNGEQTPLMLHVGAGSSGQGVVDIETSGDTTHLPDAAAAVRARLDGAGLEVRLRSSGLRLRFPVARADPRPATASQLERA